MHSGSKSLAPAALSTEMSDDGAAVNGAAKGGAAVNVEMGGANSEQASGAQPGR